MRTREQAAGAGTGGAANPGQARPSGCPAYRLASSLPAGGEPACRAAGGVASRSAGALGDDIAGAGAAPEKREGSGKALGVAPKYPSGPASWPSRPDRSSGTCLHATRPRSAQLARRARCRPRCRRPRLILARRARCRPRCGPPPRVSHARDCLDSNLGSLLDKFLLHMPAPCLSTAAPTRPRASQQGRHRALLARIDRRNPQRGRHRGVSAAVRWKGPDVARARHLAGPPGRYRPDGGHGSAHRRGVKPPGIIAPSGRGRQTAPLAGAAPWGPRRGWHPGILPADCDAANLKHAVRTAYGFRGSENLFAIVVPRCSGLKMPLPGRPWIRACYRRIGLSMPRASKPPRALTRRSAVRLVLPDGWAHFNGIHKWKKRVNVVSKSMFTTPSVTASSAGSRRFSVR